MKGEIVYAGTCMSCHFDMNAQSKFQLYFCLKYNSKKIVNYIIHITYE